MRFFGCHRWDNDRNIMEVTYAHQSRTGLTIRIHMCVDANGNPVYFEITGEQVHDSQVVGMTIENIGEAPHFIADKGYDSELIREQARHSKKPNTEFDSYLYKLRHLVENLFARLKHSRSIAIRFEK